MEEKGEITKQGLKEQISADLGDQHPDWDKRPTHPDLTTAPIPGCKLDSLTGLWAITNPHEYQKYISDKIRLSWKAGNECVVLMVDVAGLKQLNDLYSRAHGDASLVWAAGQVDLNTEGGFDKDVVRPNAHGDEIEAVLTNIPQDQLKTLLSHLESVLGEASLKYNPTDEVAKKKQPGGISFGLVAGIGTVTSEKKLVGQLFEKAMEDLEDKKLAKEPTKIKELLHNVGNLDLLIQYTNNLFGGGRISAKAMETVFYLFALSGAGCEAIEVNQDLRTIDEIRSLVLEQYQEVFGFSTVPIANRTWGDWGLDVEALSSPEDNVLIKKAFQGGFAMNDSALLEEHDERMGAFYHGLVVRQTMVSALEAAVLSGQTASILGVDGDNLKQINSRYGMEKGDQFIAWMIKTFGKQIGMVQDLPKQSFTALRDHAGDEILNLTISNSDIRFSLDEVTEQLNNSRWEVNDRLILSMSAACVTSADPEFRDLVDAVRTAPENKRRNATFSLYNAMIEMSDNMVKTLKILAQVEQIEKDVETSDSLGIGELNEIFVNTFSGGRVSPDSFDVFARIFYILGKVAESQLLSEEELEKLLPQESFVGNEIFRKLPSARRGETGSLLEMKRSVILRVAKILSDATSSQ